LINNLIFNTVQYMVFWIIRLDIRLLGVCQNI